MKVAQTVLAVVGWVQSKPTSLGSWFDQHMVVSLYPGQTTLKEVEKALKLLATQEVVVKCSVPPRTWYVWKSQVDAALEDR